MKDVHKDKGEQKSPLKRENDNMKSLKPKKLKELKAPLLSGLMMKK